MRIGIDFGTTFSLSACLAVGVPTPLLKDNLSIPSVFYYDSNAGVLTGQSAENAGESINNVKNMKREIKMDIKSSTTNFIADGRTFTNKQIVGYILKEVVETANELIKENALVDDGNNEVIISIPAKFGLREMEFIRDAAQIKKEDGGPGLNNVAFIREPVAAALAYFNAVSLSDNTNILVYDLGGGTCDVAVVTSKNSRKEQYEVVDYGMLRTGGRLWDEELVKYAISQLQPLCPNTQLDGSTPQAFHYREEIRKKAEKIKRLLSTSSNAYLRVVIDAAIKEILITREKFEELTAHLINQTMDLVKKVVAAVKQKDPSLKIDYIVCVGGSSNMPQVEAKIKEMFSDMPQENIRKFKPGEAIALGAAIYSKYVTSDDLNNNPETIHVQNIASFSYGARYIQNYEKYKDKNRHRIFNIIKKGELLPAQGKSTCCALEGRDGIVSQHIHMFEADNEYNRDEPYLPELGKHIGVVEVSGIPNLEEGDDFITTMKISPSGLMTVTAIHVKSQKEGTVEIKLRGFGDDDDDDD
ncbi:MAG: Hsp70 family protein [Clostridiaceae bacterium]|jgi:molecular chaperone DnaK (HSP70)|nr:Hsp70 family protein [Clostridiaceae bacterium]